MTDQNKMGVHLVENRSFPPSEKFLNNLNHQISELNHLKDLSEKNLETYWCEAAKTLQWEKPFTKGVEGTAPFETWFSDGEINASVNCLDRHLEKYGNKRALLWEGEPTDSSSYESVDWTYRELHEKVEAFTAALRSLGLQKGEVVAIYMPLLPESVVAMLACARAGLPHTVIFGGFNSSAIVDRVNDSGASCILTCDFGYRKGSKIHLRSEVEKSIQQTKSVKHMITLKREEVGGKKIPSSSDIVSLIHKHSTPHSEIKEWSWYSLVNEVKHNTPEDHYNRLKSPESLPAEHPLFILYTSGTTGKPKGLSHSTGGYLTGVKRSTEIVFDLKENSNDLYWCTADIGWITGHSYLVYGPLSLGTSIFMYEGAPTTPTMHRFWEMIERHRITILYTAPTAIRTFMKVGADIPNAHDLSSLRLLGTVGEPINPEAWMWYREVIGKNNCPIVDTYWQTETGSIVIAPLPALTSTKPGSATHPLPGYDVVLLNKEGIEVPANEGGLMTIRNPFPSRARTIYGDPDRFQKTYFSEFKEPFYFTGDGGRKDEEGNIWCLGRVDDVLNVSGHRLGTMEVESALVSHPKVAEAAVVGRPDEIKGQGIVAFVTPRSGMTVSADELKLHVVKEIGALARPDEIRFTEALPKTRSGKIMRRLLRELATSGEIKGDTTTLEDLNVIAALRVQDEE